MSKPGLERYREIIDDWQAFESACSEPLPFIARTNTLRTNASDLVERIAATGAGACQLPWASEAIELDRAPGGLIEHWLGLLYAQEAVQLLPVIVLDPQPEERVLDLCAAPGGKSTHIGARMRNTGCLVANEPNGRRQMGLLANINRLGLLNVVVTAYQGENFPMAERFDRILVDAPCSAEGTLRKESSMRDGASRAVIERLARLQRRLIVRAFDLLSPEGVLVYSTCTFAPEENEAIVASLMEQRDALVTPVELPVPSAAGLASWGEESFPTEVQGCRRIYPHHINSGGGFVARITRA